MTRNTRHRDSQRASGRPVIAPVRAVGASVPVTGSAPTCVVVGDFNVGKSALINALIRDDLLPTAMEETSQVPVLIAKQAPGQADEFMAAKMSGSVDALTKIDFMARAKENRAAEDPTVALFARVRATPFGTLRLMDSPGLSGMALRGWRGLLEARDSGLAVVVLDIEYWAAKHSLDLLRQVQDQFANVVVVANKADQLNRQEMVRIRETVPDRLRRSNVRSVPFFTVSARLEQGRHRPDDDWRSDTKKGVLAACDAAFDSLRLFFYEWESGFVHGAPSRGDMIAWARTARADATE